MPRVLAAAGLALTLAALALLLLAPRRASFDPQPRLAAIALLEVPYHRQAAEAFERILHTDRRFAFDRINLGLALLGIPDDEAALRALDEAEAVRAGHPTVAYARGLALLHLQRYEEARAAFARVTCPEARLHLGRVKERLGDPTAAADLLAAAADSRDARVQFVAHMELEHLARAQGRETEAERHHAITQALPVSSTPSARDLELGACAAPIEPWSADAARELDLAGVRPPPEPQVPALDLAPRAWPAAATRDPRELEVDFDHDGDLDVVRATAAGLQALRNRTPEGRPPVLAPESHAQAGLTTGAPPAVALEAGDLDDGNDLDVVAFAPGHPPIELLSLRQDRFARRTRPGPPATGAGALTDLDGDGRLDVAYPCADGVRAGTALIAWPGAAQVAAADLDLDGRPDLVVRARDGVVVLRNTGSGFAPQPLAGACPGALVIADRDGDGDADITCAGGAGWENRSGARAGFIRVTLRGTGGKTNARGTGCRVDVWCGARRERRTVRGPGEVFGLGGAARADRVRVVWTDGVIQNELAVPAGADLAIRQRPGLGASCPYMYMEGPRGLTYLTDVLAGSPVGLPSSRGGEVPADPHELLPLPRADGPVVRLRVTEEYREVTYLDRAELVVADHAPGLALFAEGGIAARRAAEEPGVLAFDRVEPVAARAGGSDVSALLARADGAHRVPPATALQGVAGRDELALDLPAVAPDRRAWLVLEGTVYWTDAGLNRRLAQSDPDAARPPRLEVPDGRGGWRVALDPLPFPAGRGKAALAEITGLSGPARLVTGMRLYLDRVAVASRPSARSPALVLTRVPVRRARLVDHGFWRLLPDPDRPPWTLAPEPRTSPLEVTWTPPRGAYTAMGDVTPLVERADDRFAILGPGDGVDLEFPLPPVRGRERTCFVLLTGFDKDGHPATRSSQSVDPLPYRNASARPLLDAEHARWRTRFR